MRELLGQGHDVICLDNFFTSQKSAVSEFLDNPHFELIRHDITHPIWLEVDQCYNLACPASPVHYWHNPIKTIKTSVLGAIHVLGMAKRTNARVLQASTSEVYGDRTSARSRRATTATSTRSACAPATTRATLRQALFFDYHRAHKVDIRLVRIFNTYGPGMHPYDGRVVSNFILQALAGEDIEVHGDGSQTRSFCYVDDLVRGLMAMMNGPDDFHGPVNLGNPGEISMLELAENHPPHELQEPSALHPHVPTIRTSAAPTSPWPRRNSAGNPPCPSPTAWTAPSTTSANWTCPSSSIRPSGGSPSHPAETHAGS
ncbi:MAG: NAD-dependent epimerase/dehydratase family protein [Planctomycetota bacterium]